MNFVFVGPTRLACAAVHRALNFSPWQADTDPSNASNGNGFEAEFSASVDTSGAASPAPEAVYKCGWTSTDQAAPITYSFSGLDPSKLFRVRMHFCLPSGAAAGTYGQQTKVMGNNIALDPAWDPYTAAGGDLKAYVLEHSDYPASDGALTVQVIPDTGKTAILCGIEVLPAIPTATTQPWVAPTPSNPPGSSVSYVTGYGGEGDPTFDGKPGDFYRKLDANGDLIVVLNCNKNKEWK